MQQFERDKFSVLEQSDSRFSFEQDVDLRHSIRSRKKGVLYFELSMGVVIVAMIVGQVAWTATVIACVIAGVLLFLSNLGSKWISEGASCTKVDINTHKNRMKITHFQRDADGEIWHSMAQEHMFDISCLEHLDITQGSEMKRKFNDHEKNIADDALVLNFTVKEYLFPVILYIASNIEDIQRIKDQLEAILASPYQVARV